MIHSEALKENIKHEIEASKKCGDEAGIHLRSAIDKILNGEKK